MAAKIPIAKGMEVDRRLGTLGGDVQSLITIVKEHGEHIRELFSNTNNGVSKAELLAALASQQRQQKGGGGMGGGPGADALMNRILSLEKEKATSHKENQELIGELKGDIRTLKQAMYTLEDRLGEVNTYSALKTSMAGHAINTTSLQAAVSSPDKPSSPVGSPSAQFRRRKKELQDGDGARDDVVMGGGGGMGMSMSSPVKAAPSSPVKKLHMPEASHLAPVASVSKPAAAVPETAVDSSSSSTSTSSGGGRRAPKKKTIPVEGQTRMGARLAEGRADEPETETETGTGVGVTVTIPARDTKVAASHNGDSDSNVDMMVMSMVLDQKLRWYYLIRP
jgi:hypothetical protein